MNELKLAAGPHALYVQLYPASPSAPAGHWAVGCTSCRVGRVASATEGAQIARNWIGEHAGSMFPAARNGIDRLDAIRHAASDEARVSEGRLF